MPEEMPVRMLDGRYRLVDRIGAGGMGEVWRAHDEHLRRDVAVKLVTGLGHGRDPNLAARFVREARAVARLSSPHIVTVYELGTTSAQDGPAVPYLVMELLDGRPLDRIVHGGAGLPALDDVARWGGQMCRALSTAHEAGVVHRDMKPANVLVTGIDSADDEDEDEDSLVKVLDFGIARLLDSTGAPTALTVTGSVVGTPAYMSPEQARGDVPIDHRTDLYSLGCVLYELVTGRLPFDAPVWHVLLRKHMEEAPVPPSRFRSELPGEWDELVLALLEKDPADRLQKAGEARKRLGELEGRSAVTAGVPSGRTADAPTGPVAEEPTGPVAEEPTGRAVHGPTGLSADESTPRTADGPAVAVARPAPAPAQPPAPPVYSPRYSPRPAPPASSAPVVDARADTRTARGPLPPRPLWASPERAYARAPATPSATPRTTPSATPRATPPATPRATPPATPQAPAPAVMRIPWFVYVALALVWLVVVLVVSRWLGGFLLAGGVGWYLFARGRASSYRGRHQ